MSLTLKPYPEYQETGHAWIGEVPATWTVRSLGSLLSARNQRNRVDLPLLSVVREKGVIVRSSEDENHNFIPDDLTNYKVVHRGDLVINKMKAWQGSLGIAPCDGIVSPAYFVFDHGFDNCRFAQVLLRSKVYVPFFAQASDGVRVGQWDLSIDKMKRIPVFLPPSVEQSAIVDFVEHIDRVLKKLIRAKRRVIELLNEQKQAIIQSVVTCGLDPNACFKLSGIQWLDRIPEHWSVVRIKRVVARIEQGWSPQCDAQPAGPEEWGVLKVGCVNGSSFNPIQNKKLPFNLKPLPELEIAQGDILISRANTRSLVGLAALVENVRPQLLLCDKLFRFRADRRRAVPRYLVLAMRIPASRAQIEAAATGASSSMQNVGQGTIANLHIPLPPVSEQIKIIAAIDARLSGLVAATDRAEREIDLLREYRTRLIADVVTGKLDMRGVALPETEEAEEVESLTDAADEGIEDSDELIAAEESADVG